MPKQVANDEIELAIREALASTRMEGLPVTPEIENRIRRLISGEVTVEERIQQIKDEQRKKQV